MQLEELMQAREKKVSSREVLKKNMNMSFTCQRKWDGVRKILR